MRTVLLLILAAAAAAAQTSSEAKPVDRTFRFQHTDTAQNFNEAVLMIRTITAIPRVTIDETEKTLEMRGDAEELGVAEWLFHELDQPVTAERSKAVHEYETGGNGENVVRLFYVQNTPEVRMFQEIVTLVRTTADIRRVYTYNAPRATVMRGNADQIALAAWLVESIETGKMGEYHMAANSDPRGDTVVRMFHIAHAESIQNFQEIATAIRTIADIRRVFTYNEPRIFVTRGTAEQKPLAEWLVQHLDQPGPGQGSAMYEYQGPNVSENIVKVFYLHSPTVEQFQHTAVDVRTRTGIRRVFTCNASRTMTVRGTVDQIEAANRMVAEAESEK